MLHNNIIYDFKTITIIELKHVDYCKSSLYKELQDAHY